jgi:plasmid stabilization system protein ParE
MQLRATNALLSKLQRHGSPPGNSQRAALHILYCVEHLLAENPKLGAPGRVPGTRELVIPKTPYIIPYRVRGSKIDPVYRRLARRLVRRALSRQLRLLARVALPRVHWENTG